MQTKQQEKGLAKGISAGYGIQKWLITVFVLTALAYLRGLSGEFVLDDRTFFLDNDILPNLSPWDLKKIFIYPSNYWGEHLPVRDYLYVIQHSFFGVTTTGYHIVSLVLYLATAYILFKFLVLLYKDFAPESKDSEWPPLLVTAVFLAHPVHVENVAYISGQKDLLCGLFSLLSIHMFYSAYRGDKRYSWKRMLLTIFFYYLSFLSKVAAVSTALIIPALWFFKNGGDNRRRLKAAAVWITINIPMVLWVLYFFYTNKKYMGDTAVTLHFPFLEHLLRGLRILGAHTLIALKPYPLNFGYPFKNSATFDSYFWIGVTVVLVFFLLLILKGRKLSTLGFLLFIVYLLPVVQIFGTMKNAIVYDRYLFIPVIGLAIIVERIYSFTHAQYKQSRYIASCLLAVYVVALGSITYAHVPKYQSDVTITRHSYERFSGWSSSSFNYVYALIEADRLDEALDITMNEHTLYHPEWVRSYFRGWIYLEKGKTQKALQYLMNSWTWAMGGGYFPYPSIPFAKALMVSGKRDYAKEVLKGVFTSDIHNPLEFYKAKKLLEQIERAEKTT